MATTLSIPLSDEIAEAARRAQVMILTADSWIVYGPGRKVYGVRSLQEPPMVACPILDISMINPEDDEKAGQIIHKNTHPTQGVLDLDGLIKGLTELGAIVTNKPCEVCEGIQCHCLNCDYGGAQ